MRNPERNIYVVCPRPGFIPFLGICGPIANPISLPAKMCLNIITSSINLYEVDPSTKDTLQLTSDNIFEDDNFGKKDRVTEIKPKVSTAPIQNFGVSASELESITSPIKVPSVEEKEEVPAAVKVDPTEENECGESAKPITPVANTEPVKITTPPVIQQNNRNGRNR